MTASCSNCKFWTWWHALPVRNGDHNGEVAMGHCVVQIEIDRGANVITNHVQGLTGEDFLCHSHKERGANE